MNIPYTINLDDIGVKTNKDIQDNQLLSLYYVHKAGNSHGNGLFATRSIFKDEEVIVATGPIVGWDVGETLYWSYGIDILIPIGFKKYIMPNNESRFINHSCEPNLGFSKPGVFVAMKNISEGEELTFDYSICDITDDWQITCLCRQPTCRKIISGKDIFNPQYNLEEKYKGYIPKYVLQKIKEKS